MRLPAVALLPLALAAFSADQTAKIDSASTVHVDTQTLKDHRGVPLRLSWQHGFLLAGSNGSFPTDHGQQLTLFDSSGKRVRKFNVLPPESKWAFLRSAAVLDDKGSIAMAINVLNADFPVPADLITFFDPKGRRTQTVRTEGFSTQALCADANGEIWAFGPYPSPDEIDPGSPMLRHFAQDGEQLAAFMPRKEYLNRKGGTRSLDQIFCGKDRLAVFLQAEETYVEIGYDGRQLDKFRVPNVRVLGTTYRFVAINSPKEASSRDGAAHPTISNGPRKPGPQSPGSTTRSIGLWWVGKQTGAWS